MLFRSPKKPLRNNSFATDTSFSSTRLKAQCLKSEFLKTGDQSLKSEYRRIFSSVPDVLDSDENPSKMSAYAYEIAKGTDWNQVKEQRLRNAEILISALSNCSRVKLIQEKAYRCYFYVAFLVENREGIQSKLNALGIFTTIIWPLNEVQKCTCPIAEYTEAHILAAPCDQRYNEIDMHFIGSEIVRIVNE